MCARCRPSFRLRDGSLSPLAFDPTPRPSGTSPAPQLQSVSLGFALHLSQELPINGCPDEGHLAHDADGSSLLCLLTRSAQQLTVVRLGELALGSDVQPSFSLLGVASMAAVVATRRGPADGGDLAVQRDLLVLQTNGRLALRIGLRLVCYLEVAPSAVEVPDDHAEPRDAAELSSMAEPYPEGGPSAGASSRAGANDGAAPISNPLETVQLLGDALEYPNHIVRLAHAVGDRVTMHFLHGAPARVALALAPTGHLAKATLLGLQTELSADTYYHLYTAWLSTAGAMSADGDAEWAAMCTVLLHWAARPAAAALQASPPASGALH